MNWGDLMENEEITDSYAEELGLDGPSNPIEMDKQPGN